MAEHRPGDHRLIEEYLAGLRRSVAGRADADDLVAELRDHLLASSEHHQRAGAPTAEADRLAVTDLGEADAVAASLRRGERGRPVVPTAFTRAAGIAGYLAAASGVAAAAAFAIGDRIEDQDGYWSSASQAWGMVGALATLFTTMSLLALLIGVVRRHGGLGVAGTVATVLAAVGCLASVIAWAVPVWGTLVAASWIVAAVATRHGSAPRFAAGTLAAGLAVFPVVAIVASPSTPFVVLDAAALVAAAASSVVLGRWLASETPVAIRPGAVATTG